MSVEKKSDKRPDDFPTEEEAEAAFGPMPDEPPGPAPDPEEASEK